MLSKQKLIKFLSIILILISFIGVSKISQLFLNLSLYNDFKIPAESILFDSFGKGASILLFLVLLLYMITNNYFLTLVIFIFFSVGVGYANNVKVNLRNEFITYSDMDALFAWDTLLPAISNSFIPIIGGVVAFFILCLLSIILIRKVDKNKLSFINGKVRLSVLIIMIISSWLFLVNVEKINNNIFKYQLDEKRTNINPIILARKNGFVSSYLHTISPVFMAEPDNYTEKEIKLITNRYMSLDESKSKDLKNEKTILILSESFISTSNYKDILASGIKSPTPYIDRLIRESGGMITPKTVGGGTANTEFSILSGFTLSLLDTDLAIPFTDFYESSLNHTASNHLSGKAIGIHSHTSTLYNRKNIYNALGFSDYRFLDEGIKFQGKLDGGKFISDAEFFREIQDVLPDYNYIHAMSIQNHYPYNNTYPNSDIDLKMNEEFYQGKNESRKEIAENYFKGIHETDKAVEKFIRDIEKSEENINVIFYGDHLPGSVIPNISAYKDKHREAPFFIYKNHGRKSESLDFKITPAFLFSHFVNSGDYKRPGFYTLIGKIIDKGIGDIYPETVTLNDRVVKISDLDDEIQQLVNDYKWIQYDSLFGKNYAGEFFFK